MKYKLPAGTRIVRRGRRSPHMRWDSLPHWEEFITTRDVIWTNEDVDSAIRQGWGFYNLREDQDPEWDRIKFSWEDIEILK